MQEKVLQYRHFLLMVPLDNAHKVFQDPSERVVQLMRRSSSQGPKDSMPLPYVFADHRTRSLWYGYYFHPPKAHQSPFLHVRDSAGTLSPVTPSHAFTFTCKEGSSPLYVFVDALTNCRIVMPGALCLIINDGLASTTADQYKSLLLGARRLHDKSNNADCLFRVFIQTYADDADTSKQSFMSEYKVALAWAHNTLKLPPDDTAVVKFKLPLSPTQPKNKKAKKSKTEKPIIMEVSSDEASASPAVSKKNHGRSGKSEDDVHEHLHEDEEEELLNEDEEDKDNDDDDDDDDDPKNGGDHDQREEPNDQNNDDHAVVKSNAQAKFKEGKPKGLDNSQGKGNNPSSSTSGHVFVGLTVTQPPDTVSANTQRKRGASDAAPRPSPRDVEVESTTTQPTGNKDKNDNKGESKKKKKK